MSRIIPGQVFLYQTGNQLEVKMSILDYAYADFRRSRFISFSTDDISNCRTDFVCIKCDANGRPIEKNPVIGIVEKSRWVFNELGTFRRMRCGCIELTMRHFCPDCGADMREGTGKIYAG